MCTAHHVLSLRLLLVCDAQGSQTRCIAFGGPHPTSLPNLGVATGGYPYGFTAGFSFSQ